MAATERTTEPSPLTYIYQRKFRKEDFVAECAGDGAAV